MAGTSTKTPPPKSGKAPEVEPGEFEGVDEESEAAQILASVLQATRSLRRSDADDESSEQPVDPAAAILELLLGSLAPKTSKRKPSEAVEAVIAEIDRLISLQVDEILHTPEVQALEATWSGIQNLVRDTPPGKDVKIQLLDLRKSELEADLADASGDFRRTKIWERICGGFFAPGGIPFNALVCDLQFTASRRDIKTLKTLAEICEDSHTQLLLGATPSMFGCKDFKQLPTHPKDIQELFQQATNAPFRDFRKTTAARYVTICMPRRIMREAYSPEFNPARGCEAYTESVEGPDTSKYLWGNPAYDLGCKIASSFANHGWPVQIRGRKGGGQVGGLPLHVIKDKSGRLSSLNPIEIAVRDQAETALSGLGFAVMSYYENSDFGVFFAVPALHEPAEIVGNAKATADARLAAQTPMTLAVSRFAHVVKCVLRDAIGLSISPQELEDSLNTWISQFCMANPEGKSAAMKARHPLLEGRIKVSEIPGRPGAYEAEIILVPHHMLDKVRVSIKLQTPQGPALSPG